eukprot:1603627-Heterocapsa_arctica.AAC.1
MEQPLAVTTGIQRCAIVPPSTRVLARDLYSQGMVAFHRSCDVQVVIFSVRKKSGALRLVVDAREANERLRRPPSTRLASTAAVVAFECPPDKELWFSIQDVADCFY